MNISPLIAVDPRSAARAVRVAKKDAELEHAAREMETVFVRQLLEAAKIGGEKSQSGYGSMAVDALAQGIEQSGGIGLTRSILDALNPHRSPPPVPPANVTTPSPEAPPAAAGTKAE